MSHILGKKQKRKKTLLSLVCYNLISDHFPCPFLVSTHCVIIVGYAQPLGWLPEDEGSVHSSFSPSLSSSLSSFPLLLPSHLFLLLQQGPSMGHGPFGRALAPAWAHLCATVPLLWSTSFCSGCGFSAFLLSVSVPLIQVDSTEVPPGWLMGPVQSRGGSRAGLDGICCAEPQLLLTEAIPKPHSGKTLAGTLDTTGKCKKQTKDLKYLGKGFCK